MTRIVYQDVEAFAAAMRGAAGGLVRTAPASGPWWIDTAELATASLQRLQTGGPFTFVGLGSPGALTFHFPPSEHGVARLNGAALDPDCFVMVHEAHPFLWTGRAACRWRIVTFPSDHPLAMRALIAQGGRTLIVCRHVSKRTRGSLAHLIDGALAANDIPSASVVDRHAAERELAMTLLQAVEQSASHLPAASLGRPRHPRSRVIASAMALMQAQEGQPLFLEDLCRATNVSERALRNIFNEYFGVGPIRLLKTRQLHEIRAALLRAPPGSDTVTRIAVRFGVIDASLLAKNYKALFGESPSQTLGRPAVASTARLSADWLREAARIFSSEALSSEPSSAGRAASGDVC